MTYIGLVSPHEYWRKKDWLKKANTVLKWKNIAAKEWTQITQNIIYSQHSWLYKTLKETDSRIQLYPFPDNTNNEILQTLISCITQKNFEKALSIIKISEEELQKDLLWNKEHNKKAGTQRPEDIQTYLDTYIEKIGKNTYKYWKDAFVFIRDAFLSNQQDKIILSNFRARHRRFDSSLAESLLKQTIEKENMQRDLITNPNTSEYFEWWDFRYIPQSNILFAWYSSSWSRNSIEWIAFVQNAFNVPAENVLLVRWKNAFHIDTFFSVVTNEDGEIISWIICDEICENMNEVKNFFANKNIPLYTVPREYWIWISEEKIWYGVINTLNINNTLLSSGWFPDSIEYVLEKQWINRKVTPTSEFRKAGWGVHCLTNQI